MIMKCATGDFLCVLSLIDELVSEKTNYTAKQKMLARLLKLLPENEKRERGAWLHLFLIFMSGSIGKQIAKV